MIRYVLALLAIALVPLSAVGQVQLPPAVAQITANPIGARAALGIPDALMSTLATRAPQPGDDSTAGRAAGDLWQIPGVTYSALQVSTGAAAWQPVNNGRALPGDLVPTAIAIYGTKRLISTYTGNLIDVVRASDSTTSSIGQVNADLDVAALDAFCALTTCTVSKIYDQTGNTNHCLQATAANRPLLSPVMNIAGSRSILFWSAFTAGTVAKSCAATLGTSVTPRITTQAWVGASRTSIQINSVFNLGGVSAYNIGTFQSTPGLGILAVAGASVVPAGPHVGLASASNSGCTLTLPTYTDNNVSAITGVSACAAGQNTATTALTIGATTTSSTGPGEMELNAFLLYNRAMSALELTNLRASLTALYSLTPQNARDIVAVDGDSITFGLGNTLNPSWSRQMVPLLNRPVTLYNLGVSGETAFAQQSTISARLTQVYRSTARNFVVCLLIGTNDIGGSSKTGAQTWAYVQAMAATIKGLGSNVKLLVSTITPRTTGVGGTTTEINNFNTLIRAGWSSIADGLIDYAADPTMGSGAANAALYGDGLHPTDLGNSYMAPIAAKAVNAVLK